MAIFHYVGANEDQIERIESMLPDHALAKAQRVHEIADERSDFHSRISRKIQEASEKIRKLKGQNARYVEERGAFPSAEMESSIRKNERRIAEGYKQIEELTKQRKLPPTLVPDTLFEALAELPREAVLIDARVSITVKKTDDLSARVGESRAVIAKLTSERGRVRRALLPKEVALHRAITDIKRAAAEGKPDFSANTRLVQPSIYSRPRQGNTIWPLVHLETGSRVIEMRDANAVLMFTLRDQLIAAATDAIEKIYASDPPPLVVPEAERAVRMAEIDEKILAESRIEEALIEEAEARGLEILRRPDAPPFAVLGIALAPAAPPEAKPELETTEFG